MEEIKLILLFFLAITLSVGLPTLISILGFRWLKRKGDKKAAFAIPVLVFGIPFYFICTAFYPSNSFYVQDFESNAGLSFPPSASIIKKDATYPDIHGDYTSRAIIELSASDYISILQRLQSDSKFNADTSLFPFLLETANMFNAEEIDETKFRTILVGGRNAQLKVGFLKDGKTIVFERHSS